MVDPAGSDRGWIFSGIGVFILSGIVWLARKMFVSCLASFGRFPFTTFRVDPALHGRGDGVGLLFRGDIMTGKRVGGAWTFAATANDWAIYGPYLRAPLRKGKYRATFRLKLEDTSGENIPVVEIDVASHTKDLGDKRLTGRTLTPLDFVASDEYRSFHLDFELLTDERDLELRLFSRGSGQRITLDSVKMSRRIG